MWCGKVGEWCGGCGWCVGGWQRAGSGAVHPVSLGLRANGSGALDSHGYHAEENEGGEAHVDGRMAKHAAITKL